MIRTILFALVVVIAGILSLPAWLCIWITRYINKDLSEWIAFRFIRSLCRVVIRTSGTRIDLRGQEHILKEQPALYVMNHRGIFDIIIAYMLMQRKTGFIAKKEFKKVPFLAQWILLNHGLFMDRENIREGLKTILQGVEYIKEGFSMVIFPEGTRNKDRENPASLLPFHGGSLKLAEKSGAPIVPVVFWNTAECFDNHKPLIKAADVKVRIGEPIVIEALDIENRRHLSDYVQGIMQGMLDEIAEETGAAQKTE